MLFNIGPLHITGCPSSIKKPMETNDIPYLLIGINLCSLPLPSVTFGFSSVTPSIEGVLGP